MRLVLHSPLRQVKPFKLLKSAALRVMFFLFDLYHDIRLLRRR
jgi:hypothetical protein